MYIGVLPISCSLICSKPSCIFLQMWDFDWLFSNFESKYFDKVEDLVVPKK